MNEVIYCGSLGRVAEYIYMSKDFRLKAVICEERQVNNDLLTFCFIRNVEIRTIVTYNDLVTVSASFDENDIYIMCSFGLIIKDNLLTQSKFFNIHPCTLPDYKGRHPTYFATINGEKYFGITLHEVNTGIDTGKIIALEEVPYYYWMTETDLLSTLYDKVPLLMIKLAAFLDNKVVSKKNEGGRYYPPVTESDKTIQPSDPPALILNKIRTQSKHGGALLRCNDAVYAIMNAHVSVFKKEFSLDKNFFIFFEGALTGIKISDSYYIHFSEIKIHGK